MTDFRALCTEFIEAIEWDGTRTPSVLALVDRARAALAEEDGVGPTDEELHQLWVDLYIFHEGPTSGDVAEIARAALARWGTCPLKITLTNGSTIELKRTANADTLRGMSFGLPPLPEVDP